MTKLYLKLCYLNLQGSSIVAYYCRPKLHILTKKRAYMQSCHSSVVLIMKNICMVLEEPAKFTETRLYNLTLISYHVYGVRGSKSLAQAVVTSLPVRFSIFWFILVTYKNLHKSIKKCTCMIPHTKLTHTMRLSMFSAYLDLTQTWGRSAWRVNKNLPSGTINHSIPWMTL